MMIVMMSVNAGHNEDEDQGIDGDNIDNLTSRFLMISIQDWMIMLLLDHNAIDNVVHPGWEQPEPGEGQAGEPEQKQPSSFSWNSRLEV